MPLEDKWQREAALLPLTANLRVIVVHCAVEAASDASDCKVQIRLLVRDEVDCDPGGVLVRAVQAAGQFAVRCL